MRLLLTFFFLAIVSHHTDAQQLVVDFDPTSENNALSHLFEHNGLIYMMASDATHGAELWTTDGTTAGTTMVKDIQVGSGDSYPLAYHVLPSGELLFRADNGFNGFEMWTTDGTSAGTTMIQDVYPGSDSGVSTSIGGFEPIQLGGQYLVNLDDGINGEELWITDGTAAGTMMLLDINPGPDSSWPSDFVEIPGGVLFRAYDNVHGSELWITDGTAVGTQQFMDLSPGIAGSFPAQFTQVGSLLFFEGFHPTLGKELFATDGTPGGTYFVKDVTPGSSSSYLKLKGGVNGKLLFTSDSDTEGTEMWVSDGTEAGTHMLKDIRPGFSDAVYSFTAVEVFGERALFMANDGVHGNNLWITDGTEEGTYMTGDMTPGNSGNGSATLIKANNFLFASYYSTDESTEPWVTNGTASGTYALDTINPGPDCSCPDDYARLGDEILFRASDVTNGAALYKININESIYHPLDTCSQALELQFDTTYHEATIYSKGNGFAPISCLPTTGKNVWYSFEAGPSGAADILVDRLGAVTSNFNVVLAVYEGDCSSLTELTCVNDAGSGGDESLALSGLTPGSMYFLRVECPASQDGFFDLTISQPPACAITDITAGAPSACDANSNTYTVEVTVTYDTAPITGDLVVNGQAFPVGTSPQVVTLIEQNSGGGLQDIEAHFSDEPSCTLTVIDAYTAPAFCTLVNDNPEGAIELTVGTECTMTQFSSVGATGTSWAQSPGCGFYQGGDVWFKFTMPATGAARIERNSISNINAQWALYGGAPYWASGSVLACMQLDGAHTLIAPELIGQEIMIRVWNYNNSSGGDFEFCVFEVTPPVNDDCANAITLPVNATCEMQEFTAIYSGEEDGLGSPGCGFYQGGDVWFNFEMPASGNVRIERNNLISMNAQYALWAGTCGNFTLIECLQLDAAHTLLADSLAGETIHIQVFNYSNEDAGSFELCLWEPTPPVNNDCADAIALPVGTECNMQNFTNAYADDQENEDWPSPGCGFYQGGDVWFTFDMPLSGHARIERTNGGTNAQFAVYTGDCTEFELYQCAQLTAYMNIHDDALAGQTLYIRVFNYANEDGGDFDICVWEPNTPDNDFCSAAIDLTVGAECTMQPFSNFGCTDEAGLAPSPGCGFYQGGDVWFKFIMPASGHLRIDRNNISGVNAQLAVYSGTCGAFTVEKCAQLRDFMIVHNDALAGQELYLRVFNYGSADGGDFELCLWEPDIPDNDFCDAAFPLTLGDCGTIYSNEHCTDEPGTPGAGCSFYSDADVWFTVEVPASGELIVDLAPGTNTHPTVALYTGVCGALTVLDCDHNSSDNGNSGFLVVNDLALAGETLYVRVFRYASIIGGDFEICAYDPTECVIYDLSEGNQTVCDDQTGFYDQELIIEYLNEPATGSLDVNGELFAITGSPQTVTLTDLFANSEGIPVTIFFTDDNTCDFYRSPGYVEPATCYCPADLNDDGVVTTVDLLDFLADFGCTSNCVADFNQDGVTDTADLLIMLSQIGIVCP